ncbi:Quinoprotein amine dehydrogenase, beta chain-like protein [Pseudocohnilembus persalinus]|uniref:Quinoprotein amine dehydrogenase, beta chain-like protein n=1 Tax=Pseudocohnilembus persalinus TaxID=266149 RepID=A0A0V0QRS5_PSEPJ|nr:Quinoprotein amine dehydrogenase, beta chain-like protein [Pseudocohnilembus persalinus]|eukprot:KRX04966.1 Quinoprotein amine dehydrogenase, beta chain-like protein [Pseudocohnilembus persalinus]
MSYFFEDQIEFVIIASDSGPNKMIDPYFNKPNLIDSNQFDLRKDFIQNLKYNIVFNLQKGFFYEGKVLIEFDINKSSEKFQNFLGNRFNNNLPEFLSQENNVIESQIIQNKQNCYLYLDFQGEKINSLKINGQDFTQKIIFLQGKIHIPNYLLNQNESQTKFSIEICFQNKYNKFGKGLQSSFFGVNQYIYSQGEVSSNCTIFPCFEQLNIKTNINFTGICPKDWNLISNQSVLKEELIQISQLSQKYEYFDLLKKIAQEKNQEEQMKLIQFKQTQKIPSYLFTFCAGNYIKMSYQNQDIIQKFEKKAQKLNFKFVPVNFYVREERVIDFQVQIEEFYCLSQNALFYLQEYFDFGLPFEKLDFVFCKDFTFYGMENPGCITLEEDRYLFDLDLENNNNTVWKSPHKIFRRYYIFLHEISHLYCGDYITINYWDDLYLKEGFATYFGHKIIIEAEGIKEKFEGIDRIREMLNLYIIQEEKCIQHGLKIENGKMTNYCHHQLHDDITYSKGALVLTKLDNLVGHKNFKIILRQLIKMDWQQMTINTEFFKNQILKIGKEQNLFTQLQFIQIENLFQNYVYGGDIVYYEENEGKIKCQQLQIDSQKLVPLDKYLIEKQSLKLFQLQENNFDTLNQEYFIYNNKNLKENEEFDHFYQQNQKGLLNILDSKADIVYYRLNNQQLQFLVDENNQIYLKKYPNLRDLVLKNIFFDLVYFDISQQKQQLYFDLVFYKILKYENNLAVFQLAAHKFSLYLKFNEGQQQILMDLLKNQSNVYPLVQSNFDELSKKYIDKNENESNIDNLYISMEKGESNQNIKQYETSSFAQNYTQSQKLQLQQPVKSVKKLAFADDVESEKSQKQKPLQSIQSQRRLSKRDNMFFQMKLKFISRRLLEKTRERMKYNLTPYQLNFFHIERLILPNKYLFNQSISDNKNFVSSLLFPNRPINSLKNTFNFAFSYQGSLQNSKQQPQSQITDTENHSNQNINKKNGKQKNNNNNNQRNRSESHTRRKRMSIFKENFVILKQEKQVRNQICDKGRMQYQPSKNMSGYLQFMMFILIIDMILSLFTGYYERGIIQSDKLQTIGQIITDLQKKQNELNRKNLIISHHMQTNNVTADLQYQIQQYLNYYYKEIDEENEQENEIILNILPDVLKEQLFIETNQLLLQNSVIFKNFSQIVQQKSVFLIKQQRFSPEDLVIEEGKQDSCSLYFIVKGEVEMSFIEQSSKQGVNNKVIIQKFKKGQCFGESCFFDGLPRKYTVKCLDFCTFKKINRQDFINLLQQNFQQDYEKFCHIKDQLLLQGYAQELESRCQSCKSLEHGIDTCKYLHLYPDRYNLINEQNKQKSLRKLSQCGIQKSPSSFINVENMIIQSPKGKPMVYKQSTGQLSQNQRQHKKQQNNNNNELVGGNQNNATNSNKLKKNRSYNNYSDAFGDNSSFINIQTSQNMLKSPDLNPINHNGSPQQHNNLNYNNIQSQLNNYLDRQLSKKLNLLQMNQDLNLNNNNGFTEYQQYNTVIDQNNANKFIQNFKNTEGDPMEFEQFKNYQFYFPWNNMDFIVESIQEQLNHYEMNQAKKQIQKQLDQNQKRYETKRSAHSTKLLYQLSKVHNNKSKSGSQQENDLTFAIDMNESPLSLVKNILNKSKSISNYKQVLSARKQQKNHNVSQNLNSGQNSEIQNFFNMSSRIIQEQSQIQQQKKQEENSQQRKVSISFQSQISNDNQNKDKNQVVQNLQPVNKKLKKQIQSNNNSINQSGYDLTLQIQQDQSNCFLNDNQNQSLDDHILQQSNKSQNCVTESLDEMEINQKINKQTKQINEFIPNRTKNTLSVFNSRQGIYQKEYKNVVNQNLEDEYVGEKFQANNQVTYSIINKFFRKTLYFTQGLSFLNSDTLLESSGTYGGSYLQSVNYKNSQIIKQVKLDDQYFGEGSDMIKSNDEIFYLTWQQRKVFVYDNDFKYKKTIDLPQQLKQGWGLTHFTNEDNQVILLATDGSNNIYHICPKTFKVIKTVQVLYNGKGVYKLNEIEIYKGTLLANTFLTNYIYQIDYNTGNVFQKLDFTKLIDDMQSTKGYENYTKNNINYCLNGIAYDDASDMLIITGKMWPWFYQVQLHGI